MSLNDGLQERAMRAIFAGMGRSYAEP